MRIHPGVALLGWLAFWGGFRGYGDWPQYRGPNHDGSASTSIRTNWLENPPSVLWKVPLGPGWSSLVTGSGRVFTQVRRTSGTLNREHTVALNADTGATLWSTDLDRAEYSNLAGYDDALDGPRSTPTLDGDRVYVLTSRMVLACLRADTGQVVWRKDLVEDLGSTVISWESAASPLVVGGAILLNCNAAGDGTLIALSKGDGRTLWRGGSGAATHASPVLAKLHGETQAIFLTMDGLFGVRPDTGVTRWRLSFSPSGTSTAASPVVVGDFVYASAAYGRGAWTARVSTAGGNFSASEAWRQRGDIYQNHWATPVALDGFIYSVGGPGPSGIRLACIEAATGAVRWSQPTVGSGPLGYGSVQRVGDVLVVVTEGRPIQTPPGGVPTGTGEVVLVRATPGSYQPLGVYPTGLSYCWNNAAIDNGRIFVRDPYFAMALDVSAAPPPLPAVRLEASPSLIPGTLVLTVVAESGLLDPSAAGRLQVQSATELPGQAVGWRPLEVDFVPGAGGTLQANIPVADERGFLRVVER